MTPSREIIELFLRQSVHLAAFEYPMNEMPEVGHGGFSDDDGNGMDEVSLEFVTFNFFYI